MAKLNFRASDYSPLTEAEELDNSSELSWNNINKAGNPFYAWEVIAQATAKDGTYLELPEWVRWYLSDVAKGMMEHVNQYTKQSKSLAAALPTALFMTASGWSAAKDYAGDKQRADLVKYKAELKASGASAKQITAALEKRTGIHSSKRALRRFIAEGETGTKRTRRRKEDQT